jgi:hypothetical protein
MPPVGFEPTISAGEWPQAASLERPRGFQEVEIPRFQDVRPTKVVMFSALRTSRLYRQKIFLVLISVAG